mmetsp:Transcript_15531/g.34541  ORF Transcript_15531/g.34541 Transcript_15531/m.34541 type:complete len:446 (+) Transcript_15531:74-1411(+)
MRCLCTRWSAVIYFNLLVYSLCFRLQSPVEPFLVKQLGGDELFEKEFGWLQSLQGFMHGVGALAMGLLMDIWGVRQSFVICYASTAVSYGILACATSLPLLFLSKLPMFLQHGYMLSQAWLSQQTSEEQRPGAFVRVTVFYSIGVALSPWIGGMISDAAGKYRGAEIATAATLLSVALCCTLPAEPPGEDDAVEGTEPTVLGKVRGVELKPFLAGSPKGASMALPSPVASPMPFRLLGVAKLQSILSRPVVLLLFALKLGQDAVRTMKDVAFPLVLMTDAGAGVKQVGEAMGLVDLVSTFLGWSLTAWLSRRLTPSVLVQICLAIQGLILVIAAIFLSEALAVPATVVKWITIVTSVLQNFSGFVQGNVFLVMLTSGVKPEERGTVIGLEHAAGYLPHIATPMLSVAFFKTGGAPLVFGSCAMLCVGLIAFTRSKVMPLYVKKGS